MADAGVTPTGPPAGDVFRALADPSRRELLDRLNARNGQSLRELCEGLGMARQSVTKHLEILIGADLVVTTRKGRERLHFLNAAPINDIADRWIGRYHQPRAQALADLAFALEHPHMSTGNTDRVERTDRAEHAADADRFVYNAYIRTTPELLWRGLTEPAFTERYWGMTLQSDWQVGSTIAWVHDGRSTEDPDQVVLVYDPFRTLSYTWHTFTPEWAEAYGVADELQSKLASEGRSKVTFTIEDVGESVKLTVVHDDLEVGGMTKTMITEGWPRVISDLKSLLESGT